MNKIIPSDLITKIILLRHKLHANAELSMHETRTKEILIDFLKKNTSLIIADRGSWFYCVRPGNNTYSIAFRADMDALPIPETISLEYASKENGISHKCGHDGHMAVLCALALLLDRDSKAHRESTDYDKDVSKHDQYDEGEINNIYLIFQPGEETGEGGRICAELIREKGIKEIYAFHNLGGFPENSIVVRDGLTQPASEGFTLRFKGKCSHASAPELGRNPSPALAETALYAWSLSDADIGDSLSYTDIGDSLSGADIGNLSAGCNYTPDKDNNDTGLKICTIVHMNSGSRNFGISAGNAQLDVTLRAEREIVMKNMENSLRRFAEKKALQYGLEIEYEICDYFPETKNDSVCLDKVRQAASEMNYDVINMDRMWRASEDFGYYTRQCPGAIFYVGTGEQHAPLHTPEYDFNDNIIPAAAAMFYKLSGDI